jgi:hypothetical protein
VAALDGMVDELDDLLPPPPQEHKIKIDNNEYTINKFFMANSYPSFEVK